MLRRSQHAVRLIITSTQDRKYQTQEEKCKIYVVRPQPTSTGHYRCEIQYEKRTIARVQENQVSLSHLTLSLLSY